MPVRSRAVAAVLVAGSAVLGTAACGVTGGATGAATPAASVPATVAASPAAYAVLHTPTPAPPTGKAPALANTGTAFPKILGSLIAYGQWLTANPDPALAGNVTVAGCASAQQFTDELQAMVLDRTYVKPSVPVLTSVSSVSNTVVAPGEQVVVDIQATRAAQPVLFRATTGSASPAMPTAGVLETEPQLQPTAFSVTLILGADKRWRFCSVVDADHDPDGEAISQLL